MSDREHVLLDLLPADTPDYMAGMWLCALAAAFGEPAIIQAFEQQTGRRYVPPRHALERQIDEATGATRDYIRAFAVWFNTEVWGPIEGGDDE